MRNIAIPTRNSFNTLENCHLKNILTISLDVSASNDSELQKSFGQHSLDLSSKESLWNVNIYHLWFVFARMDFSEQYHIEGDARDARCDERSISSQTYQL